MAHKTLPDAEYLRECFDYDPENGSLRWKVRPVHHFEPQRVCNQWNSAWSGRSAGRITQNGRIQVGLNGCQIYAHRIIWKMRTGEDTPYVDHQDHDGTNNRWLNLRKATNSQNQQNRAINKTHSVGLKGVHKNKITGKFLAHIRIAGCGKHIGTFDTAEAAHAAYCEAAKTAFGEFWCPG